MSVIKQREPSPSPPGPLPSPTLPTFRNQVAGHGSLLYISRKFVLKPGAGAEIQFYLETAELRNKNYSETISTVSSGDFHNTSDLKHDTRNQKKKEELLLIKENVQIELESNEKSESQKIESIERFSSTSHRHAFLLSFTPPFFGTRDGGVVLGNLLGPYISPCMMDLKLGTQLYEDSASVEKKQRMMARAAISTTGSLGVRVCGMRTTLPKIPQPQNAKDTTPTSVSPTISSEYGRDYGYSLKDETFYQSFIDFTSHMPISHAQATLKELLVRLCSFRNAFIESRTDGQFIGTSLLILADSVPSNPPRVAVHWIDFAHSRWSPGDDDDNLNNIKSKYLILLESLTKSIIEKSCNGELNFEKIKLFNDKAELIAAESALGSKQDMQLLFGISNTIKELSKANYLINSENPPPRTIHVQNISTKKSKIMMMNLQKVKNFKTKKEDENVADLFINEEESDLLINNEDITNQQSELMMMIESDEEDEN